MTTEMRTTAEKIRLFRVSFAGLSHVYGTYDPANGRARQVKAPVTDNVILAHLPGVQPYGVYLLVEDRTRAVVADFDFDDVDPPMEFLAAVMNYRLAAYMERSKSKGYHVWMFFNEIGVPAVKARLVVRHILEEIGQPQTEVVPKHDRLDTRTTYGNYIYAPLFGTLVPEGRTVFLDPPRGLNPFAAPWQFLEEVERVREKQLEEILEINELGHLDDPTDVSQQQRPGRTLRAFGLPPCTQRMLAEGVTDFQRVACFRLAVQLKKAGLPCDIAVAALIAWATKNRPTNHRRIITHHEILTQVKCAYAGAYLSCGCEDAAIAPYCDPTCTVNRAFIPAAAGRPSQPNRAPDLGPTREERDG